MDITRIVRQAGILLCFLALLGTVRAEEPLLNSRGEFIEDMDTPFDQAGTGSTIRVKGWEISTDLAMSRLNGYPMAIHPMQIDETQLDGSHHFIVSNAARANTSGRGAAEFDLAARRRFSSWFSAGLTGGYTTAHVASVNAGTVVTQDQVVLTNGSIIDFKAFGVDDELSVRTRISMYKLLAEAQIGPRFSWGAMGFRPFVMLGAGPYFIDEVGDFEGATFFANDDYYHKSHIYLGASGGAGMMLQFSRSGSCTLGARSERIFAPGPSLQLFSPFVSFGYHFS